MKLVSYLNRIEDIDIFIDNGLNECIVAPKALSRKGTLRLEEMHKLAKLASEEGLEIVLEWDVIVIENEFTNQANFFHKIDLSCIDTVRVQDPGVLEFVLNQTKKKIHWITEQGNHNLVGLRRWENYVGDRLDRFVVSNELSFIKLQEYSKELKTPIETLILGKILLFYTPRSLLSPLLKAETQEDRYAMADSEESPHKGFHIIENRHGTFMYHLKDLCLLQESEKLDQLASTGVWGRVELNLIDKDIRAEVLTSAAKTLTGGKNDYDDFKKLYPNTLNKGFFLVNKTDVIFPKLKNYRTLRSDESYVGEVVDVLKGDYVVIKQRSKHNLLSKGAIVDCHTPEGKNLRFEISTIKNLEGEEVEHARHLQLVIIPFKKSLVARSVINLCAKS